MPAYTTPPTEEDMLVLAEAALAAIPAQLAAQVRGIAIQIEELADQEMVDEMGMESPFELTGLYQGVPMTERSVMDVAPLPDRIVLYRLPILMEWVETGEDLPLLVGSVLVHEIAHHFGYSDEEIEAIEDAMGGAG
jgi:predicted Zn-dependent protease with MMP-like domain